MDTKSLAKYLETGEYAPAADAAPSNPDFESKHPRGNSGNNGQFRKSAKTLAKLDEADASVGSASTPQGGDSPAAEYAAVEAKYKDTPEWMKAPNGKPTNLTEKQWVQVRTPSFKAWFGDWENDPEHASKVTDSNGEPMVVLHGTPYGEFTQFDKARIGITTDRRPGSHVGGLGFYFTNDYGWADSYSKYNGSDSRPNIMKVFLNLRKPLVVEDSGWGDAIAHVDALKNDLRRWAESGRHDGIIVRELDRELDDGSLETVMVAFEPSQIKSATSNSGAFSPDKESILDSAPAFNPAAFLTYLAGKKKE